MGRCPLAPRIHRGAGLLVTLSDHMNGWKVALESVSIEQDSIKIQLTDNLCAHPSAPSYLDVRSVLWYDRARKPCDGKLVRHDGDFCRRAEVFVL